MSIIVAENYCVTFQLLIGYTVFNQRSLLLLEKQISFLSVENGLYYEFVIGDIYLELT